MLTDEIIAIIIIWAFVFIYSVAASIDFGSGFWSMFYLNRPKIKAANIANRYLSPSWEVTNVFVVLIVVSLVSFFPNATYTLGTVLLLPGSLILLLLAIRSAFLVFSHSTVGLSRTLTVISGITGLFIPALLILVLPITQGGFIGVEDNAERLLLGKLLVSPSGLAYIAFAVTSTLYLSSLLLSDYANVAEEMNAYRVYRRDAIILGPITLVCALLLFTTFKLEANWIYVNMLQHPYWLAASALCFLIAYSALFWPHARIPSLQGRLRVSVVLTIIQYLLAGTVYGIAHMPYIVYPIATIQNGFTDPSTFHALFASYIVGFAILAPGFIFFWRMFMRDKHYVKQK